MKLLYKLHFQHTGWFEVSKGHLKSKLKLNTLNWRNKRNPISKGYYFWNYFCPLSFLFSC